MILDSLAMVHSDFDENWALYLEYIIGTVSSCCNDTNTPERVVDVISS